LFNLQRIIRRPSDRFDDVVAVKRAEEQGSKDQKVQRALKERDAFRFFSGRHSRREYKSLQ